MLQIVRDTGSGGLSELVLGKLTRHVLEGLNHLHHERHQVHRDMKPGNILLNSSGEVKISDFGLSAELDSTKEMCATFIGTHAYMSPERLSGAPYGFARTSGRSASRSSSAPWASTRTQRTSTATTSAVIADHQRPGALIARGAVLRRVPRLLRAVPQGLRAAASAQQLLAHPFVTMYADERRPFDLAGFVQTVSAMYRPVT